jgi:hypothetical protein
MRNRRLAWMFACAATAAASFSECAADPRGFAMGGTDAALARGADAVVWNPALLGLPDAPALSVRIFQAGVRADNNSFDLDQYRRFNGADWADAQKAEILGSVPLDGLRLQAHAGGGAGVSFGRFGFYADGVGAGDGRFARDGVDFALYGDALDRWYDVGGTGGQVFASARAVFGAALPLSKGPTGSSAVGLQVAFERGIRWEEVSTLQATFRAAQDTAEVLGEFLLREGTRGTGFGVSVGYAHEVPSGTRLSFAVRDLLNRTSWTGTDRRYHLRGTHGLNGSEDYDSLFASTEDPAVAASFTTHRAPVATVGLERAAGRATVAVVLEKGLGDSPGVSRELRTAVGLELHPLNVVGMRGGISLGGGQGTWVSGGIGGHVGPWRFDLAVASRGLSYGSRGIGVAVGSSFGI